MVKFNRIFASQIRYNLKDYIHLHFIVLLFGFTGILGKIITLPAVELVGYRMLLAFIGIVGIALYMKKSIRLPAKSAFYILFVGSIVAVHWITFFHAIKVSNVSVTLGCMATTTLFTSILEPLIEKRRVLLLEVGIGIVIILGLYIIFQFAFNYVWGIIYALISAFLASLFGVLNRQLTQKYDPIVISLYEMAAGAILVLIYLQFTNSFTLNTTHFSFIQVGALLILAWVCTAYAFVATVYLLKKLTAYTVALAINLEPVYAIVMAYVFFRESEKMSAGFYIGALVIISSIFLYPILKKKLYVPSSS